MHLSVQRQSVWIRPRVIHMALEAGGVGSPDLDGMESTTVLFPLVQSRNLLVQDYLITCKPVFA